MNNYIQLGKEQIPISDETADNLRKQFAKKEEMRRHGDFGILNEPPHRVLAVQHYAGEPLRTSCSDGSGSILGSQYYHKHILWPGNIFDMLKEPLPEALEEIRIHGIRDYWYLQRYETGNIKIGSCKLSLNEYDKAVTIAGKILLAAGWMKQQKAKCKS